MNIFLIIFNFFIVVEPLAVSIMGGEGPLSVGQNYSFTCSASGASPPALLSWWDWRGQRVPAGGSSGESGAAQAAESGTSSSVLVLMPRPEDEGKTLTCRAEHRSLKSRLETSRVLSVSCKYRSFMLRVITGTFCFIA
jgi:hypothetical protein